MTAIRELALGAAYRFRQEGLRAINRIPRRVKWELTGRAPTREPGQTKRLEIDGWEEAALDDLNRQARGATGEWLLFLPRNANPDQKGMEALLALAFSRRDAQIIYADEAFNLNGASRFKPEFNPALLLAQNYIGLPVMIRRASFAALGGLRTDSGSAALHDLWLRAWNYGCKFVRSPGVALHNPTDRLLPTQADTLRVVARFCGEARPQYSVRLGLTESSVHVARRLEVHPEVTIVIPTCQALCGEMAGPGEQASLPHVLYLLHSLKRSSWPMQQLRVLVADDREDGSLYAAQSWPFRLERMVTARPAGAPFNYAAKMNAAWRRVETEALIFMNDDVRVRSAGWIEALLTFALDPEVGGVGARLLFPDGRLQHAGVVAGPYNTAVHAWFGQAAQQPTYQDWALLHRDWSMVTGAVFATRRAPLEDVNGFDERFALEFNDLDLCLRLGLLGYRIVYTPFAELVHFEKSSRGHAETSVAELLRFRRRWQEVIAADPAFHPALTCNGYDVVPRGQAG